MLQQAAGQARNHITDIEWVLRSAFMIPVLMGCAAYDAVCRVFPGMCLPMSPRLKEAMWGRAAPAVALRMALCMSILFLPEQTRSWVREGRR